MMTQKLLITDDQDDLRRMLRIALGYGKYVMLEAANGVAALEIAGREQPDVVVLDVMMPGGMNGFEVCRAIRCNPALSGCYVVLLTALSQQSDLAMGRAAGANAYMVKPFSPVRLVEVIESRATAPHEMRFVGGGQ